MDALKICLISLEIGVGDEVIVPAHTFIATVTAVMQTGAKPVFADINSETLLIDHQEVTPLITEKTKAIIPVHLYGIPADIEPIRKIASNHHLHLVEDYAQSVGALYNGVKTGAWGVINGSSFYPVKNLGALGDGGIITTNDESLQSFCRKFRNYGGSGKYRFEFAGLNSRLDELQAAILSVKLKHLDRWLDEKKRIAERYKNNLKEIPQVHLPHVDPVKQPAWHIFPLVCSSRDGLKNYLAECGIDTMIHYPIPPFRQPVFNNLEIDPSKFPNSDRISNSELSLPIYPGLTGDQSDYICECILNYYKTNS